jgi:CRP-like cAMP-binding protein
MTSAFAAARNGSVECGRVEAIMVYRTPHNRLLATLTSGDRECLLAGSRVAALRAGETLFHPESPIAHAYFPTDCAVALLASVAGQPRTEAGLVGREGMLGLSLVLGADHTSLCAVVQTAGHAWQVDASHLRGCLESSPTLRGSLHRYAHVRLLQLAQSLVCRSFHRLDQRLACWLLMSRDRVRSNELPLTHGFLSDMLGVRRAGVTLAANRLRESKLIRYSRGHLQLLDSPGLEASACACYVTDKRLYARFMR